MLLPKSLCQSSPNSHRVECVPLISSRWKERRAAHSPSCQGLQQFQPEEHALIPQQIHFTPHFSSRNLRYQISAPLWLLFIALIIIMMINDMILFIFIRSRYLLLTLAGQLFNCQRPLITLSTKSYRILTDFLGLIHKQS